MAQAEQVGGEAEADQRGMMGCEVQIQTPTDVMEQNHDGIQTDEPSPLLRREVKKPSSDGTRSSNGRVIRHRRLPHENVQALLLYAIRG